ncbi:MAG: SCP2 sterol-binding domain-containing protein [Deltaproteobacteria bacterium]|nr:SCP2 sterol-binding domain-containing protein [bacterium]MCB9476502.1 SCP2 sterol-binding domain-containing protein [Deltaproteobacteria bacterium]MCB9478923.1 SCP2 sterol-binding domain-containing protein [Deltaproteobacteria bacterium]MCB9489429.1 SCP2 sterol-binding domain-containing protein [Deltaproteobacteria bacterium]
MSDVQQVFDNMQTRLDDNPDSVAGMNCVYQFNVTGDEAGEWHADLTGEKAEIKQGPHASPNCTITVKGEDFVNIANGKLSGQMAFMTGKLKIAGDMGLAMKLQKLLG